MRPLTKNEKVLDKLKRELIDAKNIKPLDKSLNLMKGILLGVSIIIPLIRCYLKHVIKGKYQNFNEADIHKNIQQIWGVKQYLEKVRSLYSAYVNIMSDILDKIPIIKDQLADTFVSHAQPKRQQIVNLLQDYINKYEQITRHSPDSKRLRTIPVTTDPVVHRSHKRNLDHRSQRSDDSEHA